MQQVSTIGKLYCCMLAMCGVGAMGVMRGSGEDMHAVRQHLGSSLYQEAVRGIKADMVFEGGAWEFRDSGIDLLTTPQSHTFFKGL